MDIGPVRPAYAGPTAPVAKAPNVAPVAAEPVVEARKTVESAPRIQATRDAEIRRNAATPVETEPKEAPAGGERASAFPVSVDRVYEADDRTGEFVFKKIDKTSGDVVEQVPQEVLLRMRAALAASVDPAEGNRMAQFDRTA